MQPKEPTKKYKRKGMHKHRSNPTKGDLKDQNRRLQLLSIKNNEKPQNPVSMDTQRETVNYAILSLLPLNFS